MVAVRLGYSITSSWPDAVPPETAVSRVLDRARAARDADYDYVQVGDHHAVADGYYLQNVPMVARLSEVFDRVAAMFLLPLYHPVLVAEQVGTLARMVDEFDLWCAIGRADGALDAFGVASEERVPRFEESLEILRRLWGEDDVSLDGEFHSLDSVSINPKADPRICIGGGAPPAVRRAGRLGDAWVAGPAESLSDIDRKRALLEESGGGQLIVRRDALVLPDGDQARDLAAEALGDGYRGWPADADWPLVGDADDAATALDRLAEHGVDEVVVRPMLGDHAETTLGEVGRAR